MFGAAKLKRRESSKVSFFNDFKFSVASMASGNEVIHIRRENGILILDKDLITMHYVLDIDVLEKPLHYQCEVLASTLSSTNQSSVLCHVDQSEY